jgi:hypothetical protein
MKCKKKCTNLIQLLSRFSIMLIIASCSSVTVNNYDCGDNVYVNLTFEDGTHTPWEGQYTESSYQGESHFSISTDTPINGGINSGRFFIGAGGDYWTSPNNGSQTARSEIQLFNTANEGEEIYYS